MILVSTFILRLEIFLNILFPGYSEQQFAELQTNARLAPNMPSLLLYFD